LQYPDNNLTNLLITAIKQISVSILRQSVVNYKTDFPKEATFQNILYERFIALTPPTCAVLPELSTYFPSSTPEEIIGDNIRGEVDFYINGSLRWGIELLVKSRGAKEHLSRFGEGGKYFPLKVNDYIVVDFTRNADGVLTNIIAHEKRMTVFFNTDFSSCTIVHGENRNQITVKYD
jgi:hypothetical protein